MKFDYQDCIGARVRQLSRIVDTHFRPHLQEFGITENQMTILFALKKVGLIEQGSIGVLLSLERSTVSRNIKLLEKKSLVQKTSNYRPEIELTSEGYILVDLLTPIWESVMDTLYNKLENTGLESLIKLEEKIK
jgi:DNA-binding MarR family transcriptional regulator